MNSIASADRPAWAALVLPIALLAASMLLFVAVGAADYPSKIAKEMGHSTAQVAIRATSATEGAAAVRAAAERGGTTADPRGEAPGRRTTSARGGNGVGRGRGAAGSP